MAQWGTYLSKHALRRTLAACMLALSALLVASIASIALPGAVPPALAETQAQGSASTATSSSSQHTVVRAGYFSNGDFMHKADDGSLEGYDIEYYYAVAGYANWDVEFVEFKDLNSTLAALKDGEIDVLSGLSITDERKASFLISSQKMSTAHIAVQTRADDDRFAPGDTSTMTNMTCGILKGSNVVTLYENWCESNDLTPHVVEYDSIDLRNAALAAGEVDSIAGGSSVEGAQKIAEFPSLDLYFMFNKNRADLKVQLDRAMGIMSLGDSSFVTSLYDKYFPATKNPTPSFSASEKDFIAEHPVIRIAVLENDAPFSSKDSNGSITGILPEYYMHLSEVIGSEFECVPYASRDDACKALAAGEVDAVGKFENNIYDSNSNDVILTIPYLKMNMVQITRAGTSDVRSAAIPECNAAGVMQTLEESDSTISPMICTNSLECFDALKTGTADSVICTQPAATWLLYRNRASDYVVLAFGSDTWDASCALPYGDDGNTLRSIINKSVTVDGGYINQLITSDTLEDSADLSSIFDRFPVSMLATAAVIASALLAMAIVAIVIIVRRRKTERQLDQQRAELAAAEQVNKARHTFFGQVSHDMRTPLNGIVGFADIALESDDPARITDSLQKIKRSGAILSSLVDDMLIMSRIENGKYTLNPTPNNTSEILNGVLEPIQVLAEDKGVTFKHDTSGLCSRYVMVDRLSLQKIILNLLSNAVKFTPTGGTVSLSCHLSPADSPSPDAVIVVSDMGRGISEEFLPHIFEPFSQENPNSTDTPGSGMGLSIVKSIVDAMGGIIEAKSEQGKGTTFTVRLHFDEVEAGSGGSCSLENAAGSADDSDSGGGSGSGAGSGSGSGSGSGAGIGVGLGSGSGADASSGSGAGTYAAALSGKRVLVCEDNVLNLEIAQSMLERCGVEVIAVENGKLGLEAFEASEPGSIDAILLDLRMPVMDGRSAARAMRALNRSDAATVPIIALSADAFAEDIQQCLEAGMNAHIAKPIDPQKLYKTLAELMG